MGMKKIILSLIISLLPILGVSQTPTEDFGVQWEVKSKDFNTIKIGTAAEFTFKVKNVSNSTLSISSAAPSCGCTASSYTTTPIKPGESGTVTASYNTEGRPGFFYKSVRVTFSNGTVSDLMITGNVSSDVLSSK
jgi:hypothetical protein